MSKSVARKLIHYRSWLMALVNAGITWIILIIAPLGLFAVITCTIGVFFSSLVVGWVSDETLFSLLNAIDQDVVSHLPVPDNLSATPPKPLKSLSLRTQRQRNLPNR